MFGGLSPTNIIIDNITQYLTVSKFHKTLGILT